MRLTGFVTGLVVISTLTACGPHMFLNVFKKHKTSSTYRRNPDVPLKTETCATASDTSLDPGRVVQRASVSLERFDQRVIRKNCDGSVKSDLIEKVEFPQKSFSIKPLGKFKDINGTARNRSTCSYANTPILGQMINQITGAIVDVITFGWLFGKTPEIKFEINTSPTLMQMKVRKNADNYIDYEFSTCEVPVKDEKTNQTTCKKSVVSEKGTMVLKVNYTEGVRPGTKTVEAVDCGKKP